MFHVIPACTIQFMNKNIRLNHFSYINILLNITYCFGCISLNHESWPVLLSHICIEFASRNHYNYVSISVVIFAVIFMQKMWLNDHVHRSHSPEMLSLMHLFCIKYDIPKFYSKYAICCMGYELNESADETKTKSTFIFVI